MADRITMTEARHKINEILYNHIGKENAIGMSALYQKVYGEKPVDLVNDTRPIRIIITALRNQGRAIGSITSSNGGGYYIPRSGSELQEYCDVRLHRPALRKLKMEATIKGVSLPSLIGQMALNFEVKNEREKEHSEPEN
jgi:hypothetical protein